MNNDMYWITTLIFSVVLLIILFGEKRGVVKGSKKDKAFLTMLNYGVFFCLQDMVWGLCDCDFIKGEKALFIASTVFHLALVLTSYYCMKFFMSYLGNDVKYKQIASGICMAVVVAQIILVMSNFFYPVLFRIEGGEYAAKAFRPLSFINQTVVYFVSGIVIFMHARAAEKKNKAKMMTVFWVAIVPIITGIFQLFYPEAPFYSLGYFLECVTLYFFIVLKERNEISQERIVNAFANTFYSMHLFDLVNGKMEVYIESDIVNGHVGDRKDAQTTVYKVMDACVTDEYAEAVREFVTFSTLSDRLREQNSVTMDFIGTYHGWTRATFISVEKDENGNQSKVMFTTQIIDEQKRKEQEMFAKSHKDSLTGLYNRRAYEEDINDTLSNDHNMVYISIDVNGLKVVNDTLGHAAGDEVLQGIARCMSQCFGSYGKVYRIGGDEFAVIIFATEEELSRIKKDFEEVVSVWRGEMVEHVAVASGYVTKREYRELPIYEIAKIADERMYQDKAAFYEEKGMDRRGQNDVHKILIN